MFIANSSISCGVKQLYDVRNGGQAQYNSVLNNGYCGAYAMLIASVTTTQTKAINLLKRNGFEQVGEAKRNPNSGNNILLFVKRHGQNAGWLNPVKKKKVANGRILIRQRAWDPLLSGTLEDR